MNNVIEQLKKFYGVETLEELVLKQDEHIDRLQNKLPKQDQPILVAPSPREG